MPLILFINQIDQSNPYTDAVLPTTAPKNPSKSCPIPWTRSKAQLNDFLMLKVNQRDKLVTERLCSSEKPSLNHLVDVAPVSQCFYSQHALEGASPLQALMQHRKLLLTANIFLVNLKEIITTATPLSGCHKQFGFRSVQDQEEYTQDLKVNKIVKGKWQSSDYSRNQSWDAVRTQDLSKIFNPIRYIL